MNLNKTNPKSSYQLLTLKLDQTTLTTGIKDLTYHQQVLIVNRIRKHLSVKLKKTWMNNLWAVPRKTKGGSLRFSMRSYIMLT